MKHLRLLLLVTAALFAAPASADDLTITPASVLASSSATFEDGIAGATLTRGMLVYSDSTDSGKWKPADANVIAAKGVRGMAYGDAASGQFIRVIIKDPALTVGATLSLSAPIYVLSATAGGIAPVADLTTGWFPVPVMTALTTSTAYFNPAGMPGSTAAE